MKVKWVADPAFEALLKEIGVKFSVQTLKYADTLFQDSLKNNARLDQPLDEDTVIDYGAAMEQGRPFPRTGVQKRGHHAYILSGNHRLNAGKEVGDAAYEAYVIESDDVAKIDAIIRMANRLVGRRQDRQEALRHAAARVSQFSISVPDAASEFNVPEKSLQRHMRADKIATRLQILGAGAAVRSLGTSALLALGKVDKNDTVLRETAKVATRLSLNGSEIEELVDQIKAAPQTEEKQLAAIGQFENKTATKRKQLLGERNTKPIRTRFVALLRPLIKFLEKHDATTWNKLQVTGAADQAELNGEVDTLEAYLKQLRGGKRVAQKPSA